MSRFRSPKGDRPVRGAGARNGLPERLVRRTVKTAVRIAQDRSASRTVLSRRVYELVEHTLKRFGPSVGQSWLARCCRWFSQLGGFICPRQTAARLH